MMCGRRSTGVLQALFLLFLTICQATSRGKLSSKTVANDDGYKGCKYYKKGHVGVCNLATYTQVKTLALKKGGNHCPRTRNVSEPCHVLKCKYRFAGWGSCNKLDNTRVKLFKLRAGQPETCPSEKRRYRHCKSTRRKKGECKYRKGPWSSCDPMTSVRSRTLTLKKGEKSNCPSTKNSVKKCKAVNLSGSSRIKGLPITESVTTEPGESVFNLKLPSPPGQPRIRSSDITDTTVHLSWRPAVNSSQSKVLGYSIEYFSIGGKESVWVTASNDVEENTFTVPNLKSGTSYMFQVRAKNALGVSRPSPPSEIIRTHDEVYSIPSRPKELRLRPFSKSVLIDWAPPPSSDLVEGYIVSYGRGIPDTHSAVVDKNQMFYQLHDLEPNTEYVVRLKAFNKIGEGQPIYDAVKTLKEWTRNSALMPPLGLKSNAQSDSSIVVGWSDSNHNKEVELPANYVYQVRYGHQAGEYQYTNTSQVGVQIHDLQPFTEYEVNVRIIQGKERSVWSMSTRARTQEAAPTSPPSDVTVLNNKQGSVAVNWQPPVKANGIITGYTILYTTDRTLADQGWKVLQVAGEDLSARIQTTDPDKTLFLKVQARNRKGYGPFSKVAVFTTSAEAPGSPPSDITVTQDDQEIDTVVINWQPPLSPNGVITGYLIYYTTDATQSDRDWVLEGVTGDSLSTVITDLTPCTNYFFKIQARNKGGFGPMSTTSNLKTKGNKEVVCSMDTFDRSRLLQPVGLRARRVTSNSAVISWQGSKGLAADAEILYILRYKRIKPAVRGGYENHTLKEAKVQLTGLDANMEYEVAVKSKVNSEESSWSLTLTFKTLAAVPGGPPEDITVSAISDQSPGTVTVAWQPPAKTNGLVTGYLLYYTAQREARDGDWVLVQVGGDQLSVVLRDLTQDTTYYLKVQARNVKGFGPISRVVTYTVYKSGCIDPGCSRPTDPCENRPCPQGSSCVNTRKRGSEYTCICSDGVPKHGCTVLV